MKINFKKLNDLAKVPLHGSEYAAGYDLYAATDEDIEIDSHSTIKIGTGLAMELPEGTFGAIFARSGLATKQGLAAIVIDGIEVLKEYQRPSKDFLLVWIGEV